MKEWQRWEYWSLISWLCVRVTLDGIAPAASRTSQAVHGSNGFWHSFEKHHLGLKLWRGCWSLRLGTAHSALSFFYDMVCSSIGATWLRCISQQHPCRKRQLQMLCFNTVIHLPLPRCFISGLLVSSHIIKCACLSPGSPLIFLWFSCLMCK